MPGKYIVIEGNDGTGKSTQVELLSEHLRVNGIETFVTHEPAGTPVADAIRTVIKDGSLERDPLTNLLLFTAARHENWRVASKRLNEGAWVISARNYLSTEVYQGIGEGLGTELIHEVTRQFTDERYMQPDHTFILTLSDEERAQRIEKRGTLDTPDTFESRDRQFQESLNRGYLKLGARYGFEMVDASQPIEDIQAHIRSSLGI